LILAITYGVATVVFVVLGICGLIDTPDGMKKKKLAPVDDYEEEDLKESFN